MRDMMHTRPMPKVAKRKYYAVRRGREGPKIYENWDEVFSGIYHYIMYLTIIIF